MEGIYLDTSIFGGYFDKEFELWTRLLFDKIIKKKYKILFSRLTEYELSLAPQKVRTLLENLPGSVLEPIELSDKAIELADRYISENVVGKTSRADCLHIALATINNADILLSWNFKHIVNVGRIRGYNAVNYKLGYKMLEIRTPREVLENEN
jgi:hypothetical protein